MDMVLKRIDELNNMIISVVSGKGGTGKTTVAVNLALCTEGNIQFLDCDVEEPNAHLFLKPKIEKTETVNIPVPVVDEKKCTYCGKCQEVCAYNSIVVIKKSSKGKAVSGGKVLIFPELCHGCGGCILLCPERAIEEVSKEIGIMQIGRTGVIEFVNGKLNIGEAMSPPVIRAVKKNIRNANTVIIDAPPGTSCPVIESIKGSNYCILVTEPTPFGLNNLILAIEVLRKLNISFGVVINRSDIGDNKVEKYCRNDYIPILMRIPFRKEIAVAYSKGIPVIEAIPEYKKEFKNLFENIKSSMLKK